VLVFTYDVLVRTRRGLQTQALILETPHTRFLRAEVCRGEKKEEEKKKKKKKKDNSKSSQKK
jgi:hypothetical protein